MNSISTLLSYFAQKHLHNLYDTPENRQKSRLKIADVKKVRNWSRGQEKP
jgi:hypothetical protein